MNQKAKEFIRHVDRLYAVASRVGRTEVSLQAGPLVVLVRNSAPELKSAWEQFVFAITVDNDKKHMINHLQYFYAVMRNTRGNDAVSMIELASDVAFAVEITTSVEARSVDLVA